MSKPAPPPFGVYVPAVAFLDENEELDETGIGQHILRLAQGGVRGILVQGSNGEAQLLSHEERKTAIRITRDTLDKNGFKDTVIVAGTGAQSAKETIKLCKDAAEAGAAYVLVLTPSTWPKQMTPPNIIRFFHRVADESPLPIMIYNFPTVTAGIDLDSDTIIAIAQHPRIVGTKLSCGNIGKLHRVSSALPSAEFAAFPGKSDVVLQGLFSGSAGIIGALPNVAPKAHAHLLKLYGEGKLEEATKLQSLLGQSDWELSKLGSIGGIKAVVSKHFGYGGPHVRSPLAPLLDEQKVTNAKLEELIALEKSL
ncbi:uncharacterized protein PHACADRAFT_252672 [Phanerochaete carnosa HHB-10118-sp]|uniref:Dihydrodipicolinate synthase n=1 Tax=Phanerochaete carnosa (strain HHB-10118-sp) TaxID=650164 RepID=K5V6Q3_PHACS|nr:uncharacterized protein PHACADRAFT_252672 [Phanerochaete carnosa HHB-10118-sp]EKM58391.1 hypothetical protein PHACADRAFT_252672 [Phanerochaete carnosa HHB-10118-sp]